MDSSSTAAHTTILYWWQYEGSGKCSPVRDIHMNECPGLTCHTLHLLVGRSDGADGLDGEEDGLLSARGIAFLVQIPLQSFNRMYP